MTEKIEFAQDCTVKVGDDLSLEQKAKNYIATRDVLTNVEIPRNIFKAIDGFEEIVDQLITSTDVFPEIAAIGYSTFHELLHHVEKGEHIDGITKESLLKDKETIEAVIDPEMQKTCSKLNNLASKCLLLSKRLLDVAEREGSSNGN